MTKLLPAAAAFIAAGLAFASPVHAQAKDQTLIIYGNDRCPANTICVRRSEGERYRIPKGLRDGTLAPDNQPWASRASSASRAGAATGIGSCSNVGPGGMTGCTQQMLKQAREERRQKAAEQAASPEPTEVGSATVR